METQHPATNPSSEQKFALEVLEIFNELATPQINNRVVLKFWTWMKGHATKIILRKSDKELNEGMLKIYLKLHPKFQAVDTAIEIQKGEAMGSIKIPNVGELAKKRSTIKLTDRDINRLLNDLEV